MTSLGHHVYRLRDAEGALLYIGATSNLGQRIAQHKATKTWPGCHPVITVGERMASWTADRYETRAEAFAAERVAIAAERPLLNTKHIPHEAEEHEMPTTPEVEADFTLADTAKALRVSTRWVRDRIKAGEDPESDKPFVEHIRRGHKIMFTAEQVEKLRMADVKAPPLAESVTTGPKRGRK